MTGESAAGTTRGRLRPVLSESEDGERLDLSTDEGRGLALDLADGAVVATVNDTDSRSFADTRVVAASTTDGAVRLRRSIEDHATVAACGDAVYVAEEFSGRVRRFDVR